MFLTAGVEMVATNEEGKTPADLAKDHGHQELANRLETLVVFKVSQAGGHTITCLHVCLVSLTFLVILYML